MVLLTTHPSTSDFKTRLLAYRARHHGARPYDIAQALGVSELEVLLHSTDLMTVTGLAIDFKELFAKFPDLGQCMALTRNDAVVSEVKGVYGQPSFSGPMGMVHHDTIDLRLFTSTWGSALAVEQLKGPTPLRSVQIFDKTGRAIHKIYAQDPDAGRWQNFLDGIAKRSLTSYEIQPKVEGTPLQSVPDIDSEQLEKDWRQLQDTHDFHALLRKHKVDRRLAFELVSDELAREVSPESLIDLIQAARKAEMKFMVFVGNGAMIQIRSGIAKETRMLGSWFNILDPDFNLHVNMQKLTSAWFVRKPTRHGVVSSLEVFDERGELSVTLFGFRTDNLPIDSAWQELTERVLIEKNPS